MKTRQRKMLAKLAELTNILGSSLDGTATNNVKYIDRQKAHMLVHTVLYGVLVDDPENDLRDENVETANKALLKLEELSKRVYPDRNGIVEQFFAS